MATLFKRKSNGKYYINYTINGSRIRKAIGTDKKEAQIYLNELEYKLSKGELKEKPRYPFDYVLKLYLENCRSRLAHSSYLRYINCIKHFSRFLTVVDPVQFIDQSTAFLTSSLDAILPGCFSFSSHFFIIVHY